MSLYVAPADPNPRTVRTARGTAARLALISCLLLTARALAGGADVSTDTIYSDDVALTEFDGTPLDINGDGDVDLAVASNRGGPAEASRYYFGNGDGSFSAGATLTPGASSEIIPGDLNGDGFVDLVQGRRDDTSLYYLGNGTGFAAGVAISTDTDRTLAVALGDLDLDDDLDLVTGNGKAGGVVANPAQPNRFYLNDFVPGGSVAFVGADISADADATRSIALADMDGDGDLDVIAGNDETTAGSNRVYLNQFIESGSTAVSFAAGIDFGDPDDQTNKLLVGDLDGDGDLDIVTLNNTSAGSVGVNRFFINDLVPGGALDLGAAMDISADTDATSGGELADFDGDGDLDVAIANTLLQLMPGESPRNRLYLNEVATLGGAVSFAAGIDITEDEHQSRELAAADLNGDGDIDIVIGNQDQPDRRYLNNGTADPFTNAAPSFTSTPVIVATVAVAYTYNVTTTDPDIGDVLEISAASLPGWLTLTDNGDGTATVSGTPVAGDSGLNMVSLRVEDQTGAFAIQDFTITVAGGVGTNDPPSFTSAPTTAATANSAYSYAVTTADADGDTLAISAPVLPAWLTLTDNGDGTATLAGTPADADVGPHAVSLEVTDGTATAVQSFTVTVAEQPPDTTPPVITLTGPATVTVTLNSVYNDMGATATDDVDGDITDQIVTDSNVNTAVIGTYVVTYDVSDAEGNAATTVTRTVNVVAPSRGDAGGGSTGLVTLLALLALVGRRRINRDG